MLERDKLLRHLTRQVDKFIVDQNIRNSPQISDFINSVNQTYQNYEKDAELFEYATKLNDISYSEINAKLRDEITIKNIFEKQLILSKASAEKANEAKSEFLSIMSHEIRTPLNGIIGLIDIMEKENSLICFQENLEILKRSSDNLYILINNILDFSKIEAGKISIEKIPFNFKDLLVQIIKSLELNASENNNKIELIIDENFNPNLVSDPLRLRQIFTNLISNAVKFTKNGIIKVIIEQNQISNGISTFKVLVVDQGIGIDLEKFASIFQKFSQAESKTTRQYGGTGLGLVIVKKLLNLFGSSIKLESNIGKGSSFYFTLELPIDYSFIDNSIERQKENLEEKNLSGMRILLVEDNNINIKITVKIINRWGATVDVAENGEIAVCKYNSNKYDLVLMDLSMPVMDGYQATKIIREVDKDIPIIALSASASDGYLERAKVIGMNDFVVKPFNSKELNMKIYKYYK